MASLLVTERRRGLIHGVLAYALWGVVAAYWKLLAHVEPIELLAHRALWGLVAFGAWWIQFRWFRTNGLLWSLAGFSMLVPLIDRVVKGARYDWRNPSSGTRGSPPDAPRDPDLAIAPAE